MFIGGKSRGSLKEVSYTRLFKDLVCFNLKRDDDLEEKLMNLVMLKLVVGFFIDLMKNIALDNSGVSLRTIIGSLISLPIINSPLTTKSRPVLL